MVNDMAGTVHYFTPITLVCVRYAMTLESMVSYMMTITLNNGVHPHDKKNGDTSTILD